MKETKKVIIKRIFKAPIALVWQAITDREQMKKWYFDMPVSFQAKVGNEFEWKALDEEKCVEWLHRGKITEVIEEKKLVHSWEFPGYAGFSMLYWELEKIDEHSTQLILTHDFIEPFDSSVEALDIKNFNAGWDAIINTSLREFLEK